MEGSVLDHLGEQITGIVSPVSICMLLVVILVQTLVPHGTSMASGTTSIAMLVYDEQDSDSFSEKLGGALLNAAVFVGIVTVVTFSLVALFYLRCTRILKWYMGFSAFMVLAYMGGAVAVRLVQAFSIPVDVFTFAFVLYNLATVGVMAVFFCKMPIVFTQGYLVLIGALVAYWFTMLPEWTTWTLLVAMALYDVVAVLAPGGPLNMLVELAIARDEDIPALVYEARPMTRQNSAIAAAAVPSPAPGAGPSTLTPDGSLRAPQRQRWRRRAAASSPSGNTGTVNNNNANSATELRAAPASPPTRQQPNSRVDRRGYGQLPVSDLSQQQQHAITPPNPPTLGEDEDNSENTGNMSELPVSTNWRNSTGAPFSPSSLPATEEESASPPLPTTTQARAQALAATQSAIAMDGMETGTRGGLNIEELLNEVALEEEGGDRYTISGGIKLGLGDFIFYSLLVGRAAMYDMTTVYACYLAIVAGLGSTLLLLIFCRRALPALPISIALGVFFYFLTRLLLDPLVVDLSTHFVLF